MSKFLNTKGITDWITRIIDETERELVIITPYMQLSDNIYNSLQNANNRGVETIIIYREGKLTEKDKQKLCSIDNLNLMHHPNVHAKCFYNENYLLIASMNLYEFSEKNNREMGVLLHRNSLDDNKSNNWGSNDVDDDEIFEDALIEINQIINGAELEKQSKETIKDGFEMEILKPKKEKAEDTLKRINKIFVHKRFELLENENNNDFHFICKSYMDKVDVKITSRIEFDIRIDKRKLEIAYNNFKINAKTNEFMIDGFKMYWNNLHTILLYDNNHKHYFWKKEHTKENVAKLKKKGIDSVIEFIKGF